MSNKPSTDLIQMHRSEVFLQAKVNLLLPAQIILIISRESIFIQPKSPGGKQQNTEAK